MMLRLLLLRCHASYWFSHYFKLIGLQGLTESVLSVTEL